MLFCPRCSNLLLLGVEGQEYRFCCQTCPYFHAITQKMYKSVHFDRKEAADVESEKNWTNEDSTGTRLACQSRHNTSSPPLVCLTDLSPYFYSPMSEVSKSRCLVPRAANAICRRADDHLLQVPKLRLQASVEGGLETSLPDVHSMYHVHYSCSIVVFQPTSSAPLPRHDD